MTRTRAFWLTLGMLFLLLMVMLLSLSVAWNVGRVSKLEQTASDNRLLLERRTFEAHQVEMWPHETKEDIVKVRLILNGDTTGLSDTLPYRDKDGNLFSDTINIPGRREGE